MNLLQKMPGPNTRCLGRTKGGLNSKLHAVCDEAGKPMLLRLTAGQVSGRNSAPELLPASPPVAALIADRGYDGAWFRNRLIERDIAPCISSTQN